MIPQSAPRSNRQDCHDLRFRTTPQQHGGSLIRHVLICPAPGRWIVALRLDGRVGATGGGSAENWPPRFVVVQGAAAYRQLYFDKPPHHSAASSAEMRQEADRLFAVERLTPTLRGPSSKNRASFGLAYALNLE